MNSDGRTLRRIPAYRVAIGRAREIFEREDLCSELSPEVSGRIGKKILDAFTFTVTLPNPALANRENISNTAHDVAPRLKRARYL